jgi:hypothetical protein
MDSLPLYSLTFLEEVFSEIGLPLCRVLEKPLSTLRIVRKLEGCSSRHPRSRALHSFLFPKATLM